MLAGKRRHRLSRFFANIAGWFGGRNQHRTMGVGAATMAEHLAMASSSRAILVTSRGLAAGGPGALARDDADELDAADAGDILFVPLPAGLGWSSATPAAGPVITGDQSLAGTRLIELMSRAAAIQLPLPTTIAKDATQSAAEAARLPTTHASLAAAPVAEPADTPAPAPVGARSPLLLARRLRGVARLNAPVARKARSSTASDRGRKALSQPRKCAPGQTRAAAATRTVGLRGVAAARSPSKPLRAARWPGAQAWILSRSHAR